MKIDNIFFPYRGKVAGRTTIGEYTIDTCDTSDCGHETAIKKGNNGDWIVVEYYDDFENAKKGHKKWCSFCKENPNEVYSVQNLEIENF